MTLVYVVRGLVFENREMNRRPQPVGNCDRELDEHA
jgi:hypothetical protein